MTFIGSIQFDKVWQVRIPWKLPPQSRCKSTHHPQIYLMPLYNHSFPSPPIQATTDLLSSLWINLHSKEFYVMKLYHVDPFPFFFFFFWLVGLFLYNFFTQHNYFEIHSCAAYSNNWFFCYCWVVFNYMAITQLMYLLTCDGHLSCFHLGLPQMRLLWTSVYKLLCGKCAFISLA